MRTTVIETMVNLAGAGYCVTVCQEKYARDEYLAGVSAEQVHRFVLDDPVFTPNSAVMYMKKRYLPKAARDLIRISKEKLR